MPLFLITIIIFVNTCNYGIFIIMATGEVTAQTSKPLATGRGGICIFMIYYQLPS